MKRTRASDLAMQFPGVRAPSEDFKAARNRLQTLPLYIDVPLTTARSVATGVTSDVTDTSGKALLLPLNANFLYSDQKANSGTITIHFQDETRSAAVTPITFYPGMIARFAFTQLLIENSAQAGLTHRLVYGVDLDFEPAGLFGTVSIAGTVSVSGTVSVIEGGKARTLAGLAFSSAAGAGALAANYTFAQLWNKPASGVNLVVNRITPSLQANAAVIIGFNSVALANLNNAAQSKLAGGAASAAAEARYEQNAVAGTITSTLTSFYAAANFPTSVPLVEPIIVAPGKGLCVRADLNTVINCGFDHWEDPV